MVNGAAGLLGTATATRLGSSFRLDSSCLAMDSGLGKRVVCRRITCLPRFKVPTVKSR